MPAKKSKAIDPRPALDKRALATLRQISAHAMKTFTGKDVEAPSADDVAYAKQAGYVADDFTTTHDVLIERLFAAREKLSPRLVADAFAAGIGQKRPDWRSAIGSYAVSLHFPVHRAVVDRPNFRCDVCDGGAHNMAGPDATFEVSPNSVAYSRFEFGGGSSAQASPNYAAIDLEQFLSLPLKPTPDADDIAALRELLDNARSFPPDTTLTKALKLIGPNAGANVYQRQQTIETLSTIGVLKPAKYDTFLTRYTPSNERPDPDGRNDWAFPAIAWRGKDGIDESAVRFWFGHLL